MKQLRALVLASKSPRRKELLESIGLTFKIIPGDIDESKISAESPSMLVEKLSLEKAKAIVDKVDKDQVILASDTIVVFKDRVYGKPKDKMDAYNMLSILNGNTHYVYTGVTIIMDGEVETFYDKSSVKFKVMSREDIENYITLKNPLDKAGAYGIQDNEVVESYTGSYSNIVGLPIEKVKETLIKKGVIDGSN